MRVGVIGYGDVGREVGKRWSQAGHEVCFGYRGDLQARFWDIGLLGANAKLCTSVEAANFSDVLFLAVHWPQAVQVVEEISAHVARKAILTCVVSQDAAHEASVPEPHNSAAEEIALLLPHACVVEALPLPTGIEKAFTSNGETTWGTDIPTVFCCGDDPAAKAVVMGLVRDLGVDVVDAGGLGAARRLEAMAALLLSLAHELGEGATLALRLVRPQTSGSLEANP